MNYEYKPEYWKYVITHLPAWVYHAVIRDEDKRDQLIEMVNKLEDIEFLSSELKNKDGFLVISTIPRELMELFEYILWHVRLDINDYGKHIDCYYKNIITVIPLEKYPHPVEDDHNERIINNTKFIIEARGENNIMKSIFECYLVSCWMDNPHDNYGKVKFSFKPNLSYIRH